MTPPLEPRERLAALLREHLTSGAWFDAPQNQGPEHLADYLLAHGVTLADAQPCPARAALEGLYPLAEMLADSGAETIDAQLDEHGEQLHTALDAARAALAAPCGLAGDR